jgi:hypothetical protein
MRLLPWRLPNIPLQALIIDSIIQHIDQITLLILQALGTHTQTNTQHCNHFK